MKDEEAEDEEEEVEPMDLEELHFGATGRNVEPNISGRDTEATPNISGIR